MIGRESPIQLLFAPFLSGIRCKELTDPWNVDPNLQRYTADFESVSDVQLPNYRQAFETHLTIPFIFVTIHSLTVIGAHTTAKGTYGCIRRNLAMTHI